MIVVAKIGTSSVTAADGTINELAVQKLCAEVVGLRELGHRVIIVSSGAVTAGVAAVRPKGGRPTDAITLQALSAIGQHHLMRRYDEQFASRGLICGQVLLVAADFGHRRQYLHARATLLRMLDLDVVPIVNENDVIADDEIRFGDNDRLAALVSNLLGADLMVILTDTEGLYDADPRSIPSASLVENVQAIDAALIASAGGPGTPGSRGGMASKLAAAQMASRSGVRTVIAAANRPNVLREAVEATRGVGTVIQPAARSLSARKLWIAFALPSYGTAIVDDGARRAIVERDASLLPAGVVKLDGEFNAQDAIEIADSSGAVFAKGIARMAVSSAPRWLGKRSADLGADLPHELVHRDDLVVLLD